MIAPAAALDMAERQDGRGRQVRRHAFRRPLAYHLRYCLFPPTTPPGEVEEAVMAMVGGWLFRNSRRACFASPVVSSGRTWIREWPMGSFALQLARRVWGRWHVIFNSR